MSSGKTKKSGKSSLKKEIFLQLLNQLSHDLEWLKIHVGEKKWSNRLKKVSKLLSEGIKEKKSGTTKASKSKTVKKNKAEATPAPTAGQLT